MWGGGGGIQLEGDIREQIGEAVDVVHCKMHHGYFLWHVGSRITPHHAKQELRRWCCFGDICICGDGEERAACHALCSLCICGREEDESEEDENEEEKKDIMMHGWWWCGECVSNATEVEQEEWRDLRIGKMSAKRMARADFTTGFFLAK